MSETVACEPQIIGNPPFPSSVLEVSWWAFKPFPIGSVPETETSSQILSSIDQATLSLLLRHGLLRNLIKAEVQESLVDPEPLDPNGLQAAVGNYRKRNNLINPEQLKRHLRQRQWSQDDLHWFVSLPEKIRRTSLQRYQSKAEMHYLARKEQLDQVTYSQLTVPNAYLAQEFFLRIKENEATFAELASALRQGGKEKGQGRFGPVPIDNVPEALAKPIRACTPGTLLEPVAFQDNWLIVRLEKFQPSQFDDAMKQRMCTELFQLEVERIVDERLASLKPVLPISNDQPNPS